MTRLIHTVKINWREIILLFMGIGIILLASCGKGDKDECETEAAPCSTATTQTGGNSENQEAGEKQCVRQCDASSGSPSDGKTDGGIQPRRDAFVYMDSNNPPDASRDLGGNVLDTSPDLEEAELCPYPTFCLYENETCCADQFGNCSVNLTCSTPGHEILGCVNCDD